MRFHETIPLKRTPKYFVILLGGRFDAITVDRLKPHLGGNVVPAAPPRRGRPPKGGSSSAASSPVSTGGGGGGGSVKDRGVVKKSVWMYRYVWNPPIVYIEI
jgi:hypothetical protein